MIVPRVERDRDDIAVHRLVPPREPRAHLRQVALEHARAEVNGGIVDEDANLGALRRGLALLGVELGEAGDGFGGRPDPLIEAPVDRYGVAPRLA